MSCRHTFSCRIWGIGISFSSSLKMKHENKENFGVAKVLVGVHCLKATGIRNQIQATAQVEEWLCRLA